MTGMKEKLGDKYPEWYARHRMVENQRIWRLVMEENPMNTIPDYERALPETYSLAEAFYHRRGCQCGSCVGDIGKLAKALHANHFPEEPWVRGASSPLPELPRQLLQILRVVEEGVLSPQGLQAS